MKIVGLDEFDSVFKLFESKCWATMRYDLYFAGEKKDDFNRLAQAHEIAEDIGYACMILRDLFLDLSSKIQNNSKPSSLMTVDQLRNPIGRETMMQHTKTALMLKYLFISIRAYQDAIYKVFLIAFGETPGKSSGMSKAISDREKKFIEGNKVGNLLGSLLPEYLNWFQELRAWRNLIKIGQSASYETRQDFVDKEIEISIRMTDRFDEKKHISVGLPYVSAALTMSLKLTEIFIEHGINEKVLMRRKGFPGSSEA